MVVCMLIMQETNLANASHDTLESKANMLDIVRKLKAVDLSDNEDVPLGEEEAV